MILNTKSRLPLVLVFLVALGACQSSASTIDAKVVKDSVAIVAARHDEYVVAGLLVNGAFVPTAQLSDDQKMTQTSYLRTTTLLRRLIDEATKSAK